MPYLTTNQSNSKVQQVHWNLQFVMLVAYYTYYKIIYSLCKVSIYYRSDLVTTYI
jgi:hypothetical protein